MENIHSITDFINTHVNYYGHFTHFLPKDLTRRNAEIKGIIENNPEFVYSEGSPLSALALIAVSKDMKRIDVIGPFFRDETINEAVKIINTIQDNYRLASLNFFFPKEQQLMEQLMERLNATRHDDEFILRLDRLNSEDTSISHLIPVPKHDYKSLWTMHETIFGETYLTHDDFFHDSSRATYGYYDEGKLIGYGVIKSQTPTMHTLEVLGIDKNYRGKNHGKTLMRELISLAFMNPRVDTLELVVESKNEKALKIYQSFGFILKSHSLNYSIK